MSKYGDIPPEVLAIKVNDDYDDLKAMIDETVDEDIEQAKYVVADDFDLQKYVHSFTAWTKNYILILVQGTWGSFLIKENRSHKE